MMKTLTLLFALTLFASNYSFAQLGEDLSDCAAGSANNISLESDSDPTESTSSSIQ